MKVKISPSLMCMDLLNVQKEIEILDTKADYYHIDIIDWHYAKNLSLSPDFMKAVKSISDVPQEAHLYVDNIDIDLIDLCIDSGAEIITMPPEVVERQTLRLIRYIKGRGKKVGFFITPSKGLEVVLPFINYIDLLVILTVDPGFAGQEMIPECIDKIRQAKQLKEENNYTYEISVDGNCNEDYYRELYEAGAEVFVLGSSGLFGKGKDTGESLKIAENNIIRELEGL